MIDAKQLHLVYELTIANMKARYRKTFAGLIWVILNPMIMFGAQSVAFKHILKLDIDQYYLYLLTGLTPWIFTIITLQMTTPIIQNSGPLLKSFQINPLTLVYSQVLDNLINFAIAFVILYLPIQLLYELPSMTVILALLPLLLLLVGVTAISVLLSVWQIFFRDTSYVVSFVTSVIFFITPIFFTESMIPAEYHWLLNFHLPYHLINAFRSCFYHFEMNHFLVTTGKSLISCLILIILATLSWRMKRNAIYTRI